MGCGNVAQQRVDIPTDIKQQRDIKIEPYEYIFYGLYPPEVASGHIIDFCIERQFDPKKQQSEPSKPIDKIFLPFSDNESEYKQLYKLIQEKRQPFQDEVNQFVAQLEAKQDNSLQLMYEQQKKEQEAKDALKALEGKPKKVEKEEDMVLPPSKAPDFLQKFTPVPGMYKISFSEMFQIFKNVFPYLQEFDLYQVMCYISFNEARGDNNIASNQQKYQVLRQSKQRAYGHETFRGVFNIIQPQNFAKINVNNLHIFYYFTEIYANEYADVEYMETMLKRHFGSQHHQLIETTLSKHKDTWFISRSDFNSLLKSAFQPLISADKTRITTQNYGVNLKLFVQSQKEKFKEQGTFLDEQLERFEKQINKYRKEVALSILDNKSQQDVLDYDDAKEHKFYMTKDMP